MGSRDADPSRELSEQEFDDFVTGSLDAGNYFPLHRSLIRVLGLEAAAFLQFLINFHSRMKQSPDYEWKDGWFYCTVDKMEEELCLSYRAQRRIIKTLSSGSEPYIHTAMRGLPAKRHFYINVRKIYEIIAQRRSSRSDVLVTPTKDVSGLPISNNVYSNNPIKDKSFIGGRRLRRSPKHSSSSLLDDDFVDAQADKLWNVLARYGSELVLPSGKRRPVGIRKLKECITNLLTSVSEEEIEDMIVWLREHYGDTFTPKIHRADDFHKKWQRFKEAKQRAEQSRSSGNISDGRPIVARVRKEYFKSHDIGDIPTQEELDELLTKLGFDPGEVECWEMT